LQEFTPVVEILHELRELILALGKLGLWGFVALMLLVLLPVIWTHGVSL